MELILSIFPGIDMLGMGFEKQGFCVVKGPDPITGGDIREFHVPPGRFNGVIGGPPCQDYSTENRNPGTYSDEMLVEYQRVIAEAQPDWFLYENVVQAPDFDVPGYEQQRFLLDLAWFSDHSRRRDFVFGSKTGIKLNPLVGVRDSKSVKGGAVLGASESRSFACLLRNSGPAEGV